MSETYVTKTAAFDVRFPNANQTK